MSELFGLLVIIEIAFLVWLVYKTIRIWGSNFWKCLMFECQIREHQVYIGNLFLPVFTEAVDNLHGIFRALVALEERER